MIDTSPTTTQLSIPLVAPMPTLSVASTQIPTTTTYYRRQTYPTSTQRPTFASIVRSTAIVPTSATAATSYRQDWQNYNQNRYRSHYSPRYSPSAFPDCPVDGSTCQLPECFCSRTGVDIPGGLPVEEVPQMVLITFDGPLIDRVINILKALFDGRFRNQNRCPIGGTLFARHVLNNYDQTQWCLSHGFEIGLSTMTGTNMTQQHGRRWYEELNGMRSAVERFSYANRSLITGVRAPEFTTSGDSQLETMKHLGFQYDSSIIAEGGPFWPQTLDYRPPWNCSKKQRCPEKPYSAVWEFPVNVFVHRDRVFRRLADAGSLLADPEDLYKFLVENFDRHVEANRAPFHLPLDKEFLLSIPESGGLTVLQRFLRTVLARPYVHVVTMSQAMEWAKRPTRLKKLHNFVDWQCTNGRLRTTQPCENPSVCTFANAVDQDHVTAHSFRVCGSCPNVFPSIKDPVGSGNPLY